MMTNIENVYWRTADHVLSNGESRRDQPIDALVTLTIGELEIISIEFFFDEV